MTDTFRPSTDPIAPLLTRFAVTRQSGREIPGRYSDAHRMWVVDLATGPTPLIDAASDVAALQTKTKVDVETDDEAVTPGLELVTKTDAQQERDDETRWAGGIAELETKTEVKTEEDKQDVGSAGLSLLELTTKTATRVEEDKADADLQSAAHLELNTETLTMSEEDDAARSYEAALAPFATRLRH